MSKARITLLLMCPLLASACQRYSPKPLDLGAHRAAVEARDPTSAEVMNYARRLSASPVRPPAYDPGGGLALEEAEVVALFFNPHLRLARLRANVPRAGAAEAGRWEDPELAIDGERILQSVENRWVLGGTLGLTIPLSGRLGVEKALANTEADAAALRALAEERGVLAGLRAEWLEWSASIERAAVTRQLLDELNGLAETAGRLREAGELGPVNAGLFRLERAKQAGRLQGYETDARAAELRLKTRLGLAATARVTFVPSLSLPAAEFPDDEAIASIIAQSPRVRVALGEYAVAERTLELEVRRQYPDLRIGGGFGTDEGDDRVLFGAALPLPVFNANRRAIAEARAAREAARAAAEAEYEQLLGDVAAARARLDGARGRLRFVEQELAPLADRQVTDALRLGRAGEFDALVLLEALRAAHESKLEVLDARLSAGLAQRQMGALLETVTTPGTAGRRRP